MGLQQATEQMTAVWYRRIRKVFEGYNEPQ